MRFSISGWSVQQSTESDTKTIQSLAQSEFFVGIFCRKLIVPQKEASPFLDKKINELEVKLADMEDADDDMEDMDDEEAPATPSMPQMQTPLASDMDNMPYTPQVSTNLQRL